MTGEGLAPNTLKLTPRPYSTNWASKDPIDSHVFQIGSKLLSELSNGKDYDEFSLNDQEVLGGSNHTVCRLRRHPHIVSFNFWESGLLDLWV